MLNLLLDLMQSLSAGWKVFFISMIPIGELRVAIPLGVLWGLEPLTCFFWAICGNVVPIIPALAVLPFIHKKITSLSFGQKTIGRFVERFRRKGESIEKYGFWGLCLFVAIPLPFTGAWSGILIAFLFGWPILHATISITLGVLIAGLIVTLASAGVESLISLSHDIYYLLFIALAGLGLYLLWRWWKNRR